jgi:hypothetical protein
MFLQRETTVNVTSFGSSTEEKKVDEEDPGKVLRFLES